MRSTLCCCILHCTTEARPQVRAKFKMLVPTVRLELTRPKPPPPQDGVSTNFTTSACLLQNRDYTYFCAVRKSRFMVNLNYLGMVRARESSPSTGATGTPSTPVGTGTVDTPSMMLAGVAVALLARYARPRLVRKKAVARTAVVRLRKLADPDEPKKLPAPPPPPPPPPPPNAAPASAPFPCCIKTRPITLKPTIT